MEKIIDTHQHCWQLSRAECQWPTPDLGPIYKDHLPHDLEEVARPLGVVGSVLVQSQPSDLDSDYLLALAARNEFIQAVVAWVDLKAPDAPDRIDCLAGHAKMRGLRPMLQDLKDDAWIDDAALEPAVEAMIANRITFDALVFTRHLPYLYRFARRYPELTLVLDHAAKPPIASCESRAWARNLATMAELPNVYCKLSGLVTEASLDQGLEELRPWVETLFESFGAQRLLWGSDWPVVNLAGGYAHWLTLTKRLVAPLRTRDRQDLFSGTARKVYRLY